MFTGIISDVGTIASVAEGNDVRRLSIACGYDIGSIEIGASISCGGVCMTVVALHSADGGCTVFDVEAAPETLTVTNVGDWMAGGRVNLERSLKLGDELGGHMVSGHVDGLAIIVDREDTGETARFTFDAPEDLARFIAPKGSVALDGTSLTVNGVEGPRFDCLVIPHTLAVTTWGDRKPGDRVNIEVDTVARYVARLAQAV
jgi:riboflavin synthase